MLACSFPGIFAPLSKISKLFERSKEISRQPYSPVPRPRRIDLARVTSKVNTGTSLIYLIA